MKRKVFVTIMIVGFGFLPYLLKGQTSTASEDLTSLGVGQVNITPEQPIMQTGKDARKSPSTGVHDSLFASALFFSGKQNKALIITADLIGFSSAVIDTIKKKIYQKTGLPGENVMIVATHNHGG